MSKLAMLTFGDLCLWIDEGANRLFDMARHIAPREYIVVGDSLGDFIAIVAAQRYAVPFLQNHPVPVVS